MDRGDRLRTQRDSLARLLALSEAAAAAARTGDADALARNLRERQAIVDALIGGGRENEGGTSESPRSAQAELLAREVSDLLEAVASADAALAEEVARARDAANAELGALGAARGAVGAYAGARALGARFQDRRA